MNLKQLKGIRDNKPEGATHFDKDGKYLNYDKAQSNWFVYTKSTAGYNVNYANALCNPRSLSDINAQIELLEEIERLKEELWQQRANNLTDIKKPFGGQQSLRK